MLQRGEMERWSLISGHLQWLHLYTIITILYLLQIETHTGDSWPWSWHVQTCPWRPNSELVCYFMADDLLTEVKVWADKMTLDLWDLHHSLASCAHLKPQGLSSLQVVWHLNLFPGSSSIAGLAWSRQPQLNMILVPGLMSTKAHPYKAHSFLNTIAWCQSMPPCNSACTLTCCCILDSAWLHRLCDTTLPLTSTPLHMPHVCLFVFPFQFCFPYVSGSESSH